MFQDKAEEYNFDGLPGPTHHYAGLSFGNLASLANRFEVSHPQAAALESLRKMRWCIRLGFKQGLIPPQLRPDIEALKSFGFTGKDSEILARAKQTSPEKLYAVSSSSYMWAANAATVSPSADTLDGKVHITTANLQSNYHRSLEATKTHRILKQIFNDERYFVVHAPLKGNGPQSDEGAANHMRLAPSHGRAGLEIFVYGKETEGENKEKNQRFPARQTLQASLAVANNHTLDTEKTLFAKQNHQAIDAGVFHNDVICLSNENILIVHEEAFDCQEELFDEIRSKYMLLSEKELTIIEIKNETFPLCEVIKTYFFNSQLLTVGEGKMHLLCPRECRRSEEACKVIRTILDGNNPVCQVSFVDLTESMQNGGGPACLRLRVVLDPGEAHAVNERFMLDEKRLDLLEAWVRKNYPKELTMDNLTDISMYEESILALKELQELLGLDSIKPPWTNKEP